MNNENNENLNSENEGENENSETNENENANSSNGDASEKLKELSEKNKQLFERAKKAEGELKELKKTPEKKPDANLDNSQSNEPDYAKLAFLEQRGLTHPDDQKLVQDEANRLKLPLTDILNMGHIKSQLEGAKDQREAKAGMPKGRGDAGGKAQTDIGFWLDQKNPDGSFKTPDDPELARRVIDARINKENSSNKFSETLYTG